MQSAVALFVSLTFCACSTDNVCSDVTITRGIYGLVTYQSDVGGSKAMVVANEPIDVLDMEDEGHVVGTAMSKVDGTFEVELPSGTYALCYSPGVPCIKPVVTDGLVRADLHKGFLSYWELIGPESCSR